MHECLLLSKADALPGVSSLRRHLRAVLPEANALSDLPTLRRHLRALLRQADAPSLHAYRPAGMLSDAPLPKGATNCRPSSVRDICSLIITLPTASVGCAERTARQMVGCARSRDSDGIVSQGSRCATTLG